MIKAAKAALRVASLVIQWFHHSSAVCAMPEAEDFRDPSELCCGGESNVDLPMRERPLLIKVTVVA